MSRPKGSGRSVRQLAWPRGSKSQSPSRAARCRRPGVDYRPVVLTSLRDRNDRQGGLGSCELHLFTPSHDERMLKKTRAFVEGSSETERTQTVPLQDRIDFTAALQLTEALEGMRGEVKSGDQVPPAIQLAHGKSLLRSAAHSNPGRVEHARDEPEAVLRGVRRRHPRQRVSRILAALRIWLALSNQNGDGRKAPRRRGALLPGNRPCGVRRENLAGCARYGEERIHLASFRDPCRARQGGHRGRHD